MGLLAATSLLLAIPPHGPTVAGASLPAASSAQTGSAAVAPPSFPSAVVWTVPVPGRPAAPPVAIDGLIAIALQGGVVSARRLSDGSEAWSTTLQVAAPLGAGHGRLAVSTKDQLLLLDASDGRVVWRTAMPALTAPPLVLADALIVAAAEQITALRLTDGQPVWSRDLGTIEERPASDGTRLYVPAADGRLVALEQASGTTVWETDLGIAPTEPLVYDGRVYLGSGDKLFCSIVAATGREDWCAPVGAVVIGRAAADATYVYFAALDNLVRGFDRRNGDQRWRHDLKYRPTAGPILSGKSVSAPGTHPGLRVLDVARGAPVADVKFSDIVVQPPVYIDAPGGELPRLAALLGGLPNQWHLTLAVSVPAAPPALPLVPLTVLPGALIPVAGVR